MIWVVLVVVVIVIGAAWWLRARQPERESVDSFRRQIDALSPEARRPVVDQVQKQAEADDNDESDDPGDSPDDDEDDTDGA
jgi:cytoskeletal protein RodZ